MSHILPEKSEIKAFLAKIFTSFCQKGRFATGNGAISRLFSCLCCALHPCSGLSRLSLPVQLPPLLHAL
jgi:hypothetical protein